MKKILIFSLIGLSLILIWIFNPFSQNAVLKRYQLDGLTFEAMVEQLEAGLNDTRGLVAYINTTHLVLETKHQTLKIPIPEDLFYMSIAPFINQSHYCVTHYLTQCRSELAQETFHIKVVSSDGTVLIDEYRTSETNGFIGLWLPKDTEATLHVSYDNLHVNAPISTYEDSPTCITTPLQLETQNSDNS